MSEFDVYLDGQGFMLAKEPSGRLVPNAAREQILDPFTRHLSMDEPYTRAPFRFGDGGGLTEYDSSARYEWGNAVDTRSGRLIPAAQRDEVDAPDYEQTFVQDSVVTNYPLSSGGTVGLAERYTTPSGVTTIRSVIVGVRRNPGTDVTGASDFTVEIWSDTTGPKPNAQLASKAVSLKRETDPYSPFPDRWRSFDMHWEEVVFASDVVVGASTAYWVAVINNQTPEVHWIEHQTPGATATRSLYNGSTWANGSSEYPMMLKIGYKDGSGYQFDSFPRCFQVFAGTDLIERMYCGTGYRILYRGPADTTWKESKTVGTPVTQLLEFNEKLFSACGPSTDFWYSDGSVPTSTAWTQVSGQQSNAWAIYDQMLWKADEHVVMGSLDGTTWTATAVNVGDPGTPVTAMTAHGGKLFCAKAEGIYEISYPDTYPGSGTPTCNLLLDFRAERSPRTWLLDWHSGLYFPGLGGVYELKFDVLRNLWVDKVDEGALDTTPEGAVYTRPRSWAPLYDAGPVSWAYVHGTTRGAVFARTNPHNLTSDIIWFDGSNWYSLRSVDEVDTDGSAYHKGQYCTACFVQDLGGGRGWLWYAEGLGIARMEWPTWTEDTIDASLVNYERYSQLTTPWFSLGEQTKEILLCKVGLVSKNLTTTIHVDLSYRLDDETSWTSLGTLNTSPYQELDFDFGTTARRVQFLLALDVGSTGSSTPPIVEQLDLFYQTLTEITRTHQLVIACEADQSKREGGVDERSAAQVVADLRGLAGVSSFTYVDPLGTSHTCRITGIMAQVMDFAVGPGPTVGVARYQAIVSLLEL